MGLCQSCKQSCGGAQAPDSSASVGGDRSEAPDSGEGAAAFLASRSSRLCQPQASTRSSIAVWRPWA